MPGAVRIGWRISGPRGRPLRKPRAPAPPTPTPRRHLHCKGGARRQVINEFTMARSAGEGRVASMATSRARMVSVGDATRWSCAAARSQAHEEVPLDASRNPAKVRRGVAAGLAVGDGFNHAGSSCNEVAYRFAGIELRGAYQRSNARSLRWANRPQPGCRRRENLGGVFFGLEDQIARPAIGHWVRHHHHHQSAARGKPHRRDEDAARSTILVALARSPAGAVPRISRGTWATGSVLMI